MRFVGLRSLENQAALMRHKAREMLVCQRPQLLNGLRGHLAEVGVIAARGPRQARDLAALIEDSAETIPIEVCEAVAPLMVQLRNLDKAIARLDRAVARVAHKDDTARRLMSMPCLRSQARSRDESNRSAGNIRARGLYSPHKRPKTSMDGPTL